MDSRLRLKIRRLKPEIWKKTNGRCFYCGLQLQISFHVDHVWPQHKGGDHTIENLVPCCQSCNSTKGPKTIEELRRWMVAPRFSEEQIVFLKEIGSWDWIAAEILIRTTNFKFWFETNLPEKEAIQ